MTPEQITSLRKVLRVELRRHGPNWQVLIIGGNTAHALGFVREADARETVGNLHAVLDAAFAAVGALDGGGGGG